MITIDQLLESVDLDFEPRWITKDEDGNICICDGHKPEPDDVMWDLPIEANYDYFGKIKLSEFDGKDWKECIYEVPRKTDEYEQNIEKLRPADSDLVYRVNLPRKTTIKIEKLKEVSIIRDGDFPSIESTVKVLNRIINRLNELVDAVNELKGAKNE